VLIVFTPAVHRYYQTPMDAVGFIPTFLSDDDPRPMREQIDENYASGGGWHELKGGTLDTDSLVYRYPGDPPMPPLAVIVMRDEQLVVYDCSVCAIVQKDNSYTVSRLD